MGKKSNNLHVIHEDPINTDEPIKTAKEKPELSNEEFVNTFIETKQKYSDRLAQQKEEQDAVIECLHSPIKFPHASQKFKSILLNERRKLVAKFTSKIPKQKIDESEKEKISRLLKLDELRKNVKKYDDHYEILMMHLDHDDLKY